MEIESSLESHQIILSESNEDEDQDFEEFQGHKDSFFNFDIMNASVAGDLDLDNVINHINEDLQRLSMTNKRRILPSVKVVKTANVIKQSATQIINEASDYPKGYVPPKANHKFNLSTYFEIIPEDENKENEMIAMIRHFYEDSDEMVPY